MDNIKDIKEVYDKLLGDYGPQGWWPLLDFKGTNPTKTGSITGYHVGDYDFPLNRDQVYEICCGAILTQNVGWVNVEKALFNLKGIDAIKPEKLLELDNKTLTDAIKPAGYFNQKAKKLKEFTKYFLNFKGVPKREDLLSIWGIGPETADSILLYAYRVPTFVVDAYTRRIFSNIGFISEKASYDEIKELFENNLKPDLIVYQEYHALLVEHAKRYYSKKGEYHNCPLYKKYKIKK